MLTLLRALLWPESLKFINFGQHNYLAEEKGAAHFAYFCFVVLIGQCSSVS